jgi:hypothetical protein
MTDPQKKTASAAAKAPATPVEVSAKPQPHRFRVSVPVADEAVLTWMGLQDNPSLSVRMLIRESIERLGYVDLVNRPVAQLPKRGRPFSAGEAGEPGDRDDEARDESAASVVPPPAAAAVVSGLEIPDPQVDQGPEISRDLDLSDGDDATSAPELLGIALEAPTRSNQVAADQNDLANQDDSAAADPASPDPEPGSDGQIEVNDIFANLR